MKPSKRGAHTNRDAAFMARHARLAPSSADRWMLCPGSVAAEEQEPDDDNEWGAEGSVAHIIFERSLRWGFEPHDFIGHKIYSGDFQITVTDEMADDLWPIIDEIRDSGGDQHYEHKVDLTRWLPDQYGTLDVAGIHIDEGYIDIEDLKFGRGVPVQAKGNAQLRIYGGGFWDNIAKHVWPRHKKKPRFRIRIHQPRNNAGGGVWEISYDELMEFMDTVAEAGERTYEKDAPRIPGDKQCSYCRAAQNGHCRAYDEWNLAKFGAKFANYQKGIMAKLPDPEKMDPEVRALIVQQAPALRQWLSRLTADAINEYMRGTHDGVHKVIAGRKGRREWRDPEAAQTFMDDYEIPERDRFKPRELISPTTVEKFVGKDAKTRKVLSKFITQADGRPALVLLDHPGKPLESYNERFVEYEDGDD